MKTGLTSDHRNRSSRLRYLLRHWRRPHRRRPRIPVPWAGCGSPRWRSPKTDSGTLRSAGVCVGICKGSFGIVRYRSVVRRGESKERKSSRARATLEYIRGLCRSTPSFLPIILIAHSVISGTYQVAFIAHRKGCLRTHYIPVLYNVRYCTFNIVNATDVFFFFP